MTGGGNGDTPVLYFKRGCSGCDAARRWLAQHGVTVHEREIFKQPLSPSEIEDIAGARPIADLLSTRTKQYAAHGLNVGEHSEADLLRHMETEPRLIRRPLLRLRDTLLVGFDVERWSEALLK